MKKLISIYILLCITIITKAQNNNTEAKVVYQLAEEKFTSQKYKEAIIYLEQAEKLLGRTNPPMDYLKVMISDQIANQAFEQENGLEMLKNLEKSIAIFENSKGKDALGEDKIMEVYRIKLSISERKAAFEKWFTLYNIQKTAFVNLVNRLATEYPKTQIPVGEFLNHPMSWNAPNAFDKFKVSEKVIHRYIDLGGSESLFYKTLNYNKLKNGQLFMEQFKTKEKGIDIIDHYLINQYVNDRPQSSQETNVTSQNVIDLLHIPTELWEGISWNRETFIKFYDNWFTIYYESSEKKENGEPKKFILQISNKLTHRGSSNPLVKKTTFMCLSISVKENTL